MENKKPWESKTIWLNGIIGLAAALAVFVPWASGIQPWINTNSGMIAMVWSFAQVLLRWISKDKIQLRD